MTGLGNMDDVYKHYLKVIEENQQLKELLLVCRRKAFEIRLALSDGRVNNVFDLTYQLENKIDNAIGEK